MSKATAPNCPVCGKPVKPELRPFCSTRCADVDLGRWLSETYRVPGENAVPLAGGDDNDED